MLPQQLGYIAMFVAYCISQRSTAALILGVDLCTFGDEQFHNILASQRSSYMERGITILVFGVDVRTLGDEQFYNIVVPLLNSVM